MEKDNHVWGVVEMMGHLTIAGRITKPGEYGGLWQIDIPEGDSFRTEFFGSQSVYRIRITSEEIARAYARPSHEIIEYNAPIITRAEHESAMGQAKETIQKLRNEIWEMSRALPAGAAYEELEPDPEDDWEDEYWESEAEDEALES